MQLRIFFTALLVFVCIQFQPIQGQTTQIPNADFETWITHTGYADPQYWDTPNQELLSIPIFGQAVVTKSNSAQSGSFAARLETKRINIPGSPVDVPGVITLGKLNINLFSGTYSISGGAPVHDQPSHLKGFFKFSPVGGDSCAIGIMLFKTTGGIQDTIALGYFSSKDNVPDWTPFSAWINYFTETTPDTMNILAISTAQYNMNNGTVLYIDNLELDYTLGVDESTPGNEISVYQDKETQRLLVYPPDRGAQPTSVVLYNLMGQKVFSVQAFPFHQEKIVVPYYNLNSGIYILEVLQGYHKYCRKFFLNP